VSDHDRDQAGVLALVVKSQAETILEQSRTIEILSGARGKSLALKQTIAEMWERHFATLPDVAWKRSVDSIMRLFLTTCGHITLGDFCARDFEVFRESPEARSRYGETSLNIILTRIKIALNRAVAAGELFENPLRRVRPLRGPGRRRTEISETDEMLISADLDQHLRTLYIVSVDSLMRREEARLLQWSEIDLENRVVHLAAERTKGRAARDAFLTTRAVKLLRSLPKIPGCPWVFANPDTRKPWGKTRIWNHFRRAVDDNGIKAAPGDGRVRWHDGTRRTGARRLVRLGAPLPAVQQLMGHKEMATTLTYVEADRRDVLAAHALLERSTRRGPQRSPAHPATRTKRAAGS